MSAYGDILSAFPELIQDYEIFDMKGKLGGYGPRTNQRTVRGIFRKVPGGKLGIAADNRQVNEVASFWCFEDEAVKVGQAAYMELPDGLYLMTKDNGYVVEAGYAKYTASIVPGPTDQQVEDPVIRGKFIDGFE